jgi:FAD/FMN-containing dehydrogenase
VEWVTPGHPSYDETRWIFDRQFDRRPALIARRATDDDIGIAVRHAREHLKIAVRGGGHSLPGYSTTDGGTVIDVSALSGVVIDPRSRRARVRPGALVSHLLAAGGGTGLAAVTGSEPLPSYVGLAIHGGRGPISRRYGWASDHIRSGTMITADGERITVSAEENTDLLYGLRGVGSNFGVVAELEVHLQPVAPAVSAGKLVYAPESVPAVTAAVLAATDGMASDGLGVRLRFFMGADDGPYLELTLVHLDDERTAERDLATIRAAARPVAGKIGRTGYADFLLSGKLPPLNRFRWEEQGSTLESAELTGPLLDHAARLPRATVPGLPGHYLIVEPLGPGFQRVPDLPTPVRRRSGASIAYFAGWSDPQDDDAFSEWVRAGARALREDGVGDGVPSLNYNSETGPTAGRRADGANAYAKLQQLKARYDPENVFHRNHNVEPGTSEV